MILYVKFIFLLFCSEIRQKNEGGWDFTWDEDSKAGHIILEVHTPRFLDSSLIDVDIHPTYVSVIIKSKVLRLKLPAEIHVTTSRCQRSKTNGHLSVIMPKVNPRETVTTMKIDPKQLRAQQNVAKLNEANSSNSTNNRVKYTNKAKAPSIHDLMMQEVNEAKSSSAASTDGGLLDAQVGVANAGNVDVTNIIPQKFRQNNLDNVQDSVVPPTPPAVSVISSSLITEVDMTALD